MQNRNSDVLQEPEVLESVMKRPLKEENYSMVI